MPWYFYAIWAATLVMVSSALGWLLYAA